MLTSSEIPIPKPPDPLADVSKRQLTAAKNTAIGLANKAKNGWGLEMFSSWETMELYLGIQLDPGYKLLPFNRENVWLWANAWVQGFEERLRIELTPKLVEFKAPTRATKDTPCQTYGIRTLFPEQQITKDRIFEKFFVEKQTRALLQDGDAGSGKTFVAAALIADCIHKGLHKEMPIPFGLFIVVTKKNVVEQYCREIENFGLGQYLGSLILVTSYSQLTSSYGKMFVTEEYDPVHDTTVLKWNPGMKPLLVIWDECHGLNNWTTQQTEFAMAMNRQALPPFQVFMSATPFVCINHTRTFVVSTRARFMGMQVNEVNFKQFAGLITPEPDKPNLAAAKRLRDLLKDYIVSMPYVKWAHKAINCTLLMEFDCEEDRILYARAYQQYIDDCLAAGKNTNFGQLEKYIAIGQFRKRVEPLRIRQIVKRAIQDIKNGKAPVLALAFRESVMKAVACFEEFGYGRDRISIIWGGKKAFDQKKLLSDEQAREITMRIFRGDYVDAKEIRALRETVNFKSDRIFNADSSEEAQVARWQKYKDLNLTGTQSAQQRQKEIDAFQSGQTDICIFTLAAGGTGLSLDHSLPHLKPRVVYITPTYSGPEFKQGLGRCVRRATLSDTYQFVCLMAGTIEESHVAPLIDKKLKFISTVTKSQFNLVDLIGDAALEDARDHKIRTIDEAEADSENEDSQIHILSDKDEEDSEDDEATVTA